MLITDDLVVASYLRPPPQSLPVRRFSRCRLTATPQPGSSSCFLSASLWPRRTVASTPGTDLREGQEMSVICSHISRLNSPRLQASVVCAHVNQYPCCHAKFVFSRHCPGWYPWQYERCRERCVWKLPCCRDDGVRCGSHVHTNWFPHEPWCLEGQRETHYVDYFHRFCQIQSLQRLSFLSTCFICRNIVFAIQIIKALTFFFFFLQKLYFI